MWVRQVCLLEQARLTRMPPTADSIWPLVRLRMVCLLRVSLLSLRPLFFIVASPVLRRSGAANSAAAPKTSAPADLPALFFFPSGAESGDFSRDKIAGETTPPRA